MPAPRKRHRKKKLQAVARRSLWSDRLHLYRQSPRTIHPSVPAPVPPVEIVAGHVSGWRTATNAAHEARLGATRKASAKEGEGRRDGIAPAPGDGLPGKEGKPTTTSGERPRRQRILVRVAVALAVLACIAATAWISTAQPVPWLDPAAQPGHPASKSAADIRRDDDTARSSPMMTTRASSYVIVEPGSTHCPGIDLENIASNQCDQVYTLKLRGTGEIVYTSGAVPPGHHIDDIELLKPLERGVYDGMLVIRGYACEANAFGRHEQVGPVMGRDILVIVESDGAAADKIVGEKIK